MSLCSHSIPCNRLIPHYISTLLELRLLKDILPIYNGVSSKYLFRNEPQSFELNRNVCIIELWTIFFVCVNIHWNYSLFDPKGIYHSHSFGYPCLLSCKYLYINISWWQRGKSEVKCINQSRSDVAIFSTVPWIFHVSTVQFYEWNSLCAGWSSSDSLIFTNIDFSSHLLLYSQISIQFKLEFTLHFVNVPFHRV